MNARGRISTLTLSPLVVTLAAHTELLQQTREHQRCEAEHAAQIRRLETELEQVSLPWYLTLVPHPLTSPSYLTLVPHPVTSHLAEQYRRGSDAGAPTEAAQAQAAQAESAQVTRLEARVAKLEATLAAEQRTHGTTQAALAVAEARVTELAAKLAAATSDETDGNGPSRPVAPAMVAVREEEEMQDAPPPKRPLGESAQPNRVELTEAAGASPSKKARESRTSIAAAEVTRRCNG